MLLLAEEAEEEQPTLGVVVVGRQCPTTATTSMAAKAVPTRPPVACRSARSTPPWSSSCPAPAAPPRAAAAPLPMSHLWHPAVAVCRALALALAWSSWAWCWRAASFAPSKRG